MGETNYAPVIRDMTWSYSRMSSFDSCPYKWYLRYLCQAKGKDMFFAQYGSFVHELLADFYEGRFTAEETYERYLRGFRSRVNVYHPNRKVWRSYFDDGANYLRSLAMPADRRIIGVEKEIHFEVDGASFIGFIDRLDELPDGNLVIVDHKSRKLKPRSGRKKPTKTDQELDEYLRQLYLYSKWVSDTYGRFPSVLCLNCFRSGVMIEEPFRPEVYEEVLRWAAGEVKRIEQAETFTPDPEYFKCLYLCELHDKCEVFKMNHK